MYTGTTSTPVQPATVESQHAQQKSLAPVEGRAARVIFTPLGESVAQQKDGPAVHAEEGCPDQG